MADTTDIENQNQNQNQNHHDDIANQRESYKRLKNDVVLFVVMFFIVQTLLLNAVSSSSPSKAKCMFRVGPLFMSLCAGIVELMAIIVTSVSLVQVMVQLKQGGGGGGLFGNWRIVVVVAGNVIVGVCFAVFMWMIYDIPCRGVRLD